jgi:N-acetyl sugar amidotransferase
MERLDTKKRGNAPASRLEQGQARRKMRYCSRCVYPEIAVFVTLGDDGVCSGCRVNADKPEIDWNERGQMLKEILEEFRSKDGRNYDCIIPVSGGKDSYFQAHVITKVYGMNPLLVTYHGNNYLPEGEHNLNRMREVFGVDHIIFKPSVPMLVKMNRAGLKVQGDMNWHAHCGIATYPIQIAVKLGIPLLIWGEHGPTHIGGQHSLNDLVEMNARARKEHYLRGFDWDDFVGVEGLTANELLWAKYPSDEDLERVGVRQIHLGNYVHWDENNHAPLVMKTYDWLPAQQPFERTYRMFSNLDDMHENGIHDYLKFVKFGYGRATDHASKDIRAGRLTRPEAVELVRKYDSVKPRRDLERWLKYVNMSEEEFDAICDSFRDPRVWWREGSGEWRKDNLWDG